VRMAGPPKHSQQRIGRASVAQRELRPGETDAPVQADQARDAEERRAPVVGLAKGDERCIQQHGGEQQGKRRKAQALDQFSSCHAGDFRAVPMRSLV